MYPECRVHTECRIPIYYRLRLEGPAAYCKSTVEERYVTRRAQLNSVKNYRLSDTQLYTVHCVGPPRVHSFWGGQKFNHILTTTSILFCSFSSGSELISPASSLLMAIM